MKKLFTVLAITLFFAVSSNSFAQLAKSSWGFGFGGAYPQLIGESPTIEPDELGFGGYLSLQRNFSEHSTLRFKLAFNQLSYEWGPTNEFLGNTNHFVLGISYLYYFVPCETVSPYLMFGVQGSYNAMDNSPTPVVDDFASYGAHVGLGMDFSISDNWSITSEISFHAVRDSRLDGVGGTGNGGMFGSNDDNYMNLNLGFLYTFSKGEASKYCQLYDGINVDVPEVDYERIENIVKKHIPEVIEKQVVVKETAQQKWVLVGVNYDFNKATLKSESYPVLFHAVQVLLMNPDMRVEIQGHTDNIGSDDYNMKLGQKRADAVKDYLVARGISADRLSTRSFGESQPIADNKTADGRAINRRVEFKVLN